MLFQVYAHFLHKNMSIQHEITFLTKFIWQPFLRLPKHQHIYRKPCNTVRGILFYFQSRLFKFSIISFHQADNPSQFALIRATFQLESSLLGWAYSFSRPNWGYGRCISLTQDNEAVLHPARQHISWERTQMKKDISAARSLGDFRRSRHCVIHIKEYFKVI